MLNHAVHCNATGISLQIHYDNAGDDAGEAVEVIFPTGSTVLLTLYNGTPTGTTSGASYGTLPLPAGTPLGSTGFSIACTPAVGIQNGPPDGIALICNGAVIQFLSYEGTFTAANGPAAGRLSTDIGVAEAGEHLDACICCKHDAPGY
jgi:hypothetical protein